MAIVGIGMDIVEISRIEEIIGRSGERSRDVFLLIMNGLYINHINNPFVF